MADALKRKYGVLPPRGSIKPSERSRRIAQEIEGNDLVARVHKEERFWVINRHPLAVISLSFAFGLLFGWMMWAR